MLGEMKLNWVLVEAASIFLPYLQIDNVDTRKTHKFVELAAGKFGKGLGGERRESLREVEAK